MLRKNFR